MGNYRQWAKRGARQVAALCFLSSCFCACERHDESISVQGFVSTFHSIENHLDVRHPSRSVPGHEVEILPLAGAPTEVIREAILILDKEVEKSPRAGYDLRHYCLGMVILELAYNMPPDANLNDQIQFGKLKDRLIPVDNFARGAGRGLGPDWPWHWVGQSWKLLPFEISDMGVFDGKLVGPMEALERQTHRRWSAELHGGPPPL